MEGRCGGREGGEWRCGGREGGEVRCGGREGEGGEVRLRCEGSDMKGLRYHIS